jgi:hypothetical protein
MRQNGSMQQYNLFIWPILYGYTGWLWGATFGWPVTVAIAATLAGFFVGALMIAVSPFVLGPITAWAALILPWFLGADTWRWTALALCISPLVVGGLGLALGRRWT